MVVDKVDLGCVQLVVVCKFIESITVYSTLLNSQYVWMGPIISFEHSQ